jgi:hypothetical protein
MDPLAFAHFKERYALMSDDELVYITAAKSADLTEEAQAALRSVIQARHITEFHNEIAATTADLAAQAKFEAEQVAKKVAQQAAERRVILLLCAIAVLGGLIAAGVGELKMGLGISGTGVVVAIWYELHRLFRKFVAAMFRMN